MILTDPSYYFNITDTNELFASVYQDTQLASEVIHYYQDQFAMAKIKGVKFPKGSYRNNLERLVNNKISFKEDKDFAFDSNAHKFIGMAKYLLVQYEVDTVLEDNCTDLEYADIVHNFSNFENMRNNVAKRPSTFTSAEQQNDTILPDARTVNVRELYQYTKSQSIYYICDSILGPIKLTLPSNSSFRHYMDRKITTGMDIRIGYGKVRPNISYDTGIFIAEYWEVI